MPDDIETAWIDPAQFRDGGIPAAILATELQFAQTGSAAKRLVKQGGFRVNGNTVTDPNTVIEVKEGDVVQRGKREFRKVGFLRESVVGREPEAQNERKSFLKDDMA
jgi:tyrosyl-tRNA synthetase